MMPRFPGLKCALPRASPLVRRSREPVRMSVSVVAARPDLPLNPGAESFVSSRSGSEMSSPPRCSSPEAPERGPIEARVGP